VSGGTVHWGGTTFCPGCAAPLIERDWHAVLHYALDAQGGCPHCGTRIAGRFAPKFERGLGRQRIPVRIAAA
jgi:pyruvate formate lyase activating enzyme